MAKLRSVFEIEVSRGRAAREVTQRVEQSARSILSRQNNGSNYRALGATLSVGIKILTGLLETIRETARASVLICVSVSFSRYIFTRREFCSETRCVGFCKRGID